MTALEGEAWLQVPGFPDYDVTSLARVWSRPRVTRDGKHVGGRFLKPNLGSHGYLTVRVTPPGGKSVTRTVHSLVLEAFKGPCPAGKEARHLDGVSTNNVASNLEWGTNSENQHDKVRHGTHHYANRTECKNGHELTGENVRVKFKPDGTFKQRVCLLCMDDYHAAWQERNKKPPETLVCPNCGESFVKDGVGSSRKRYCKPQCAQEAWRARQHPQP